MVFFFSSGRRHTRWPRDWSSDVCSSDLRLGGNASPAAALDGIAIRAWPLSLGPRQAVDVEVHDGSLQCPFGLLAAADKIGRASCRGRGSSTVDAAPCSRTAERKRGV